MSSKIITCIFQGWVVASIVLSEAYKGMILSYLTTPTGEPTPKTGQELLTNTIYRLFSFETIRKYTAIDSEQYAPLLEYGFEPEKNINALNGYIGGDYHLLKQATIQGTNLDSPPTAAEFLHQNAYMSSGALGALKTGNVSTTKFAFLYLEASQSFIPIVTFYFSKLMASSSIEIGGPTIAVGWFTTNGILFKLFAKSMSHLASAGFAEAFGNHWRAWNPCIYLDELLHILKHGYNVSNLKVNVKAEVSRCLQLALSRSVDGNRHHTQEPTNTRSLSVEQLSGVFKMTLFCPAGSSLLLISEWIIVFVEKAYVKPST